MTIRAAGHSVWFVGDLGDPWVASLAEVLPEDSERIACDGRLPAEIGEGGAEAGRFAVGPRVLILHRSFLTDWDAGRVARLRASVTPRPRVVLCVGPHVRHAELERWTAQGLVDAVVPEATARDTITRHLGIGDDEGRVDRPARQGTPPRVAIVGTNVELRMTLADACELLGFRAELARDWSDVPAGCPAIWDVPVLEPDWPAILARRTRAGPVIVLLGFADRAVVREARGHGATACLELPYDLLDLGHVLGSLTADTPATAPSLRNETAHSVPPVATASRARARARSRRSRAAVVDVRDSGRPERAGPGLGS